MTVISKTRKRNMRKHGLDINAFSDSLAAYRLIVRERKRKQRDAKKEKRSIKRAGRRSSDTPKKKK